MKYVYRTELKYKCIFNYIENPHDCFCICFPALWILGEMVFL